MNFCPICNNFFDITNLPNTQLQNVINEPKSDISEGVNNNDIPIKENTGGSSDNSGNIESINYNQLIDNIIKNKIDKKQYKNINVTDLKYSLKKYYQKNKLVEDIELLYNKIIDKLNLPNIPKNLGNKIKKNMYYICNNCGYSEKIKNGTKIFSSEPYTFSNSNTLFDCDKYINNNTLPLTKNYTCPNINCETHNNSSLKEALFFRINTSYKLQYICKICKHVWIPFNVS